MKKTILILLAVLICIIAYAGERKPGEKKTGYTISKESSIKLIKIRITSGTASSEFQLPEELKPYIENYSFKNQKARRIKGSSNNVLFLTVKKENVKKVKEILKVLNLNQIGKEEEIIKRRKNK